MNRGEQIASPRHTLTLGIIMLAIAFVGGWLNRSGAIARAALTHSQIVQLYLWLIVWEWALVYGVLRGVRRRGLALVDLIGQNSPDLRELLLNAVLAAAVWTLWLFIQSIFPRANDVRSIFPRTSVEIGLWVLVASSAGFCEEFVFRGYFQRQFLAITGSMTVAVLLQAVLFGLGHLYEGTWAVVKIALYGVLFGVLAAWRRSLRPGILAHAWSDLFVLFAPR